MINGIISGIITPIVKRSTHYLPVTETSSQRPPPYERSTERSYERSVKRVVTTEPQTIQTVCLTPSLHRDTRKPLGRPRACVKRTAAILTSRTTVDREGDGRIREELKSLGGR